MIQRWPNVGKVQQVATCADDVIRAHSACIQTECTQRWFPQSFVRILWLSEELSRRSRRPFDSRSMTLFNSVQSFGIWVLGLCEPLLIHGLPHASVHPHRRHSPCDDRSVTRRPVRGGYVPSAPNTSRRIRVGVFSDRSDLIAKGARQITYAIAPT